MKIKKEVKVGVLMLVAISLLAWGANFLKGTNILNKNRHFYAIYEKVDGLGASNPVIINGFKVGQVEKIEFLPDFSGNIIVKFSVTKNDFPIPSDTKAKIMSADILGSKTIDLQLGSSKTLIKNNDTLQTEIEASLTESVNQQIAPLKKKAEDLINTVDSAILIVSAIFNKNARTNLDSSFASIRGTLETFEKTMINVDRLVDEERKHLDGIFKNVESITENFAKSNNKLTSAIANMEAITDSLAGSNLKQTVNNASIAMQQVSDIMQRINNGEGSLGALINNDTLYINLEKAAYDLDQLMLDLRLNPERYVHFSIFGRKDKGKSD